LNSYAKVSECLQNDSERKTIEIYPFPIEINGRVKKIFILRTAMHNRRGGVKGIKEKLSPYPPNVLETALTHNT